MILCLDVGNTQIYGGIFENEEMTFSFRMRCDKGNSSDEYGVFLKSVLSENSIDVAKIKNIAICTVVPEVLYSLNSACKKYFDLNPFILEAGVKTGLKIGYRNPLEVGADRIANAIAATILYPNKDSLIIDFGTATTFCAVSAKKEYLGGVILPGMKMSMSSLERGTSKLPSVEIRKPKNCLGRSTVESIQSGLFFGTVGSVREVIQRLTEECFGGHKPVILGTGGFANLLKSENLFDEEAQDLVLKGLYLALKLNT